MLLVSSELDSSPGKGAVNSFSSIEGNPRNQVIMSLHALQDTMLPSLVREPTRVALAQTFPP